MELQREVDRLRHMNDIKSKMFSMISHNMIAPLQYMKNITGYTNENWEDLKDEELKECAQIMHESSESLLNLSQSILDWNENMTSEEHKASEVSLSDIIEEERQLFKPALNDKSIQWVVDIMPGMTINIERAILRLLLQNVISNAIKFSNIEGKIQISGAVEDDQKTVIIQDFGVGLTKEQMDMLQDPKSNFTMKGTKNELGFGIGLLIVEDLLTLSNGRLKIESVKGEGTKVSLYFPE